MWKKVYILFLSFRFYLVFQPLLGYIHPDEFFQGPEKIAGDILHYDVHIPWEFESQHAIRSPFLWYMLCGYPFSVVRALRVTGAIKTFNSYWLLVAPRLVMSILSILTDHAIMRIAALLGCSPYIAGCLSATSYVTLVFYTRTFSNSLESFFLAMLLVCTCEYVSTHGFHISKESKQSSVTGSLESNTNEAKTEENVSNNLPKSSSAEDKDGCEVPPTVYEDKSGSNREPMSGQSSESNKDETSADSNWSINPDIKNIPQINDDADVEVADSADSKEADDTQFDVADNSNADNLDVHRKSKMGQLMEKHALSTSTPDPNQDCHPNKSESTSKKAKHASHKTGLAISVVVIAGIWNRPTFLGFALVPILYWLFAGKVPRSIKEVFQAVGRGLFNLPYLFNTAIVFILFDTSYYRSKSFLSSSGMFDQFVVSPLNFLLYNRNSENLSEHGLHPRYLHILVNLPLLFGPLMAFFLLFVFMVLYIKNKAHRHVMIMLFLTTATPLALLSMFPHQEPRFIIPLLVPAVVIATYGLNLINSKALYALFIIFWIPHNFFLGFLFGNLHQAGVVPSLIYLNNLKSAGRFNRGEIIVYHRTYMPPKSLLQIHVREADHIKLVDLQGGVDDFNLEEVLSEYDSFFFVSPYCESQLRQLLGDRFSVELERSFYPHLSLEDPPDIDSILTYDNEGLPDWQATFDSLHLYLSLNIYRLTNRKLIVQTYPSSNSFKNTGDYVGDEDYEVMAITLPKITSLNM